MAKDLNITRLECKIFFFNISYLFKNTYLNITRLECKKVSIEFIISLAVLFEYHQIGM